MKYESFKKLTKKVSKTKKTGGGGEEGILKYTKTSCLKHYLFKISVLWFTMELHFKIHFHIQATAD